MAFSSIQDAMVREEQACETVTLETCFEWLTEEEQLSKDDAVYCSRCKKKQRCFNKLDIWAIPPVLVLQLKRFEYTGVERRRVDKPVGFPLEGLDLSRFCLQKGAPFPEEECHRIGSR
eukprot:5277557-Amphidinium_carterae.1